MLKDKKILLIAPNFHHYHKSIKDKLESLGAHVVFFQDVLNNKLFAHIRHKTFRPLNKFLDKLYFKYVLSCINNNEFDVFFLIRGELIDEIFLEKLRNKIPNAKFLMYQWDSLVHHNYENIIEKFDETYSFDSNDAKSLNVKYLPLFYTDEYELVYNSMREKKYDIVFVGTYHSDRLEIIKKIDVICKKFNLKFKHHLYTGKFYKFKLWLRGKFSKYDLKYLKTDKASLKDIIRMYEESRVVLDIEMSNQTGLTIRTVEALAAGMKIITTNEEIKYSEVYDPMKIYVLNRDKIELNINFIMQDIEINQEKFKNFSLENWLMRIIKG